MKKIFFPVAALTLIALFSLRGIDFNAAKAEEVAHSPYLNDLIYQENLDGTLTVIGVNPGSINKTNLRIYGYHDELNKDITKIGIDAFKDLTNLSSLMISENINQIENNALNISSLQTIYYTGSLSEWNELNYETDLSIMTYSFDEGFINYWNEFIRPSKSASVCDISRERYTELKYKYNQLGSLDKDIVNSYEDLAGETIKSSLEYLENYFNPKQDKPKENKISKDVALTIVIGIAIFGMTSIAVFYLLMKKNIIS